MKRALPPDEPAAAAGGGGGGGGGAAAAPPPMRRWRGPDEAAAQLAAAAAVARGRAAEAQGNYVGVIVATRAPKPAPTGLSLMLGLDGPRTAGAGGALTAVCFADAGAAWARTRAGCVRLGDVLLAPAAVVQAGVALGSTQLKLSRKKPFLVLRADWLPPAAGAPPAEAAVAAVAALLTGYPSSMASAAVAAAAAPVLVSDASRREAVHALDAAGSLRREWLARAGVGAAGCPAAAPRLPLSIGTGVLRDAQQHALLCVVAAVPTEAPTHLAYACGGGSGGGASSVALLQLHTAQLPQAREAWQQLLSEVQRVCAAAATASASFLPSAPVGIWAQFRHIHEVAISNPAVNLGELQTATALLAERGMCVVASSTVLLAADLTDLLALPAGSWPADVLPPPLPFDVSDDALAALEMPVVAASASSHTADISDEALATFELAPPPLPLPPPPPPPAPTLPLAPPAAAATELIEAAIRCLPGAPATAAALPVTALAELGPPATGAASLACLRRVRVQALGCLPFNERELVRMGPGGQPQLSLQLCVQGTAGDATLATLVVEADEADVFFAGVGATAAALAAPDAAAAAAAWAALRRALRALASAAVVIDCLVIPLPLTAGAGLALKLLGTRMRPPAGGG